MKRILFFVLFIATLALTAIAQQPQVPDPITPDANVDLLLNWWDLLYAAIFYIVGFFHNVIPINVEDKWLRVASFALVVGVVLFVFITDGKWQDAIGLIISFAIASGIIYPAGKLAGVKSPAVRLKKALPDK